MMGDGWMDGLVDFRLFQIDILIWWRVDFVIFARFNARYRFPHSQLLLLLFTHRNRTPPLSFSLSTAPSITLRIVFKEREPPHHQQRSLFFRLAPNREIE